MEIRPLDPDDLAASRTLSIEAFGPWPGEPPPLPTSIPAGRHAWGAFDDGRLVARVEAHEYDSWWHGVALATCGIAGVAVAAEHRGEGLLTPLFERVLGEARGRGDVLSTLYPTAPGIYRSLGYELVSSLDTVEVPTAELGRLAAARDTTTRRAQASDLEAVRTTYAAWAAAQNGPLTRTGPMFGATDGEVLAAASYTLAVDPAGRVVGYVSWAREGGYGPTGTLRLHDLIALSGDAYRALWRAVGSFASVAPVLRLTTSGADPARLLLPSAAWAVVDRRPYMLRVLDIPAATRAATDSSPVEGTAEFAVAGDRMGTLDGYYRTEVSASGSTVARITDLGVRPTFTPQGLALTFAGNQSCANLRMLDHLAGPDDHDALLDALFGGRPLHVRDYF